ncbi:MAG: multicopper oxidase domain-containing protein, partial [Thiolinea sp.]
SVHWHGIRIDNRMDGVSGLTQAAVEPGGQFLYDFVVPDAGTYWYHSHNRSWEQMARGLYGSLIVEEAEAPQVDRDEVWLIDDWRLGEDAQIVNDFGQMMQMSHGGRTGNWLTVNGVGMDRFSQTVKQHERLRLRLINTANASLFTLRLQGMQGKVVALDGQPLEQPEALGDVLLAPGQRADLLVDVMAAPGTEAQMLLVTGRDNIPIGRFPVQGSQRSKPLPAPEALPANPLTPLAQIKDSPVTELRMQGGAMGSMRKAIYQGEEMHMRALVQQGMAWAFNGVAGMTDEPLLTAQRGGSRAHQHDQRHLLAAWYASAWSSFPRSAGC